MWMHVRSSRARTRRIGLGLLGLCFALGCAHQGPFAHRSAEEGLASYYSLALAGRSTASGEPYDPGALTAAHRSLPFGSVVQVERTDGAGAPVRVRINDRGPFVRGRIIDLSDAAATRLRMKRDGVVPVRLQIVSLPGAR
jgi:rare lipoprotein A